MLSQKFEFIKNNDPSSFRMNWCLNCIVFKNTCLATNDLLNLENCFKMGEISTKIKIICLIDDICTTGTTLNECAKILKQEYPCE